MSKIKTPKILVFSGAGLSADSGVRTFSGQNGIYGRFKNPEKILTSGTLRENPALIHNFCDDLRTSFAAVKPNAAHHALAALETSYGSSFMHFTQNVDNLAERAGNEACVHIHGLLTSMRSIGNSKVLEDISYHRYWDGDPKLAHPKGFKFRCCKSNSLFRPDVILFGEQAPLYASFYKAIDNLNEQDIAIVIGTRGEVVSISALLYRSPCKKVLINPEKSEFIREDDFNVVLRENAGTSANTLLEIVKNHMA